ncbi:MAG: helix-turn-helix domain-containing protein [Nitrososphaeraceae archaeon]|jgi:transposase
MAPNKSELSYLYRSESEPKVKERLLLVLKVKGNGVIPARAAKELDRSRTWSTNWLMRYDQEGVHGLKNKPRSGRPPKLSPKIAFEIRRELSANKHGWTTKQVEDLIFKKGGGRIKYHYTHIYRLLHKWGFKLKVPRKAHINTASKEEKDVFKKEIKRS